mgnify:CR=1 FL=1
MAAGNRRSSRGEEAHDAATDIGPVKICIIGV